MTSGLICLKLIIEYNVAIGILARILKKQSLPFRAATANVNMGPITHNLLPECTVPLSSPYPAESLSSEVPHHMPEVFVIAAGNNVAVSSDYRRGPHP